MTLLTPLTTAITNNINTPEKTATSAQLLTVEQATMNYGQRILWKNVSFAIQTGEFVALLGANGTGKTTLFKTLLGLCHLQQGRVQIASNINMGYVPQLKDFDPKLPIRGRDLVRLGLDGGNYFFGWINDKRKKTGKIWLSAKQKNYMVDRAIAEVGGQAFAEAPLHLLSGGEQQRMRIAQALVAEPELILMDEPLLSLDVASQKIVCDILAHRKQTHHTAIFMISHEIQPILPLVDKVVYLNQQKATIGKPSDILPNSDLFCHHILDARL